MRCWFILLSFSSENPRCREYSHGSGKNNGRHYTQEKETEECLTSYVGDGCVHGPGGHSRSHWGTYGEKRSRANEALDEENGSGNRSRQRGIGPGATQKTLFQLDQKVWIGVGMFVVPWQSPTLPIHPSDLDRKISLGLTSFYLFCDFCCWRSLPSLFAVDFIFFIHI